MTSSKVAVGAGALAVLVAACGNGSTSGGATSGGGGLSASSSSAPPMTTCTQPACAQLIQCCETGHFVDDTQRDTCLGFINSCTQCDSALSTYETIGACTVTATTTSSGTGGASASSSSSTSTSTSVSSSSSSSSSGSCALPDDSGKPYVGLVELGLGASPTAPNQHSVLGEFTAAPSMPAPACAGTQVGACCFQPPGGATPPTFQSAGTLKITDGAKTLAKLTAPPYIATSATLATLTWAPGNTLKVTGSGGTVDAFDLTVVAPALLVGVSPAFGANPIDVKKSVKLVVTWTPSPKPCSQVTFSLSQLPATPALPYIGCVAEDSAGTLTVPASLLGMLTATTGTAVIERVESAGVLVANAGVKVVAVDGHYASVKLTP